jgi:hypothetical protein
MAPSNMSATALEQQFRYPYEEFAESIKAMPLVRRWEYTSRFGYVGTAQNSRANNARVVEYFSDCYSDSKEALYKAELFLSMCDYLGRHAAVFTRKQLLEIEANGVMSVESALLRAVHSLFLIAADPTNTNPKKLLPLVRALQDIAQ